MIDEELEAGLFLISLSCIFAYLTTFIESDYIFHYSKLKEFGALSKMMG